METRASYVLVGSFVLGLVAAAVIFILWMGRGDTGKNTVDYVVRFTGSVTGLAPGAAVRYRGINKGEVRSVDIADDEKTILVNIRVAQNTPVRTDTVASLEAQGLTGSPFVQLKPPEVDYPGSAKIDPKNPPRDFYIKGESSGLDRVFEELPKALKEITTLARQATKLVDDENQENFRKLLRGANAALASVESVAKRAETGIADISALAKRAETGVADISSLAKRGEVSLGEIDKATQSIAGLMVEARSLVKENRRPIADFAATGLYEFSLFLTDMRKFVRTFDRLLTRVESDPSQFLFGNRQRGFETPTGNR